MSHPARYRYLFVTALAAASTAAAGKEIQGNQKNTGYWLDQRGTVVVDPYGLCWRTGYFSKELALPECDPGLVPPPPPPPPPPPVKQSFSEKMTFGSDSLFDFDRATLKPAAQARLDELVEKMRGADITAIHLAGYTDSVGTQAYNMKLSERRANAVRDYLVSKGINPSLIDAHGNGALEPVASNATAEGRAKNRRVEVEVDGYKTILR